MGIFLCMLQEVKLKDFTHLNKNGEIRMVDVTEKENSLRYAKASGEIFVSNEVIECIKANKMKKGNVLEAARMAGIMALKKTSDFIPLCHSIFISWANISFNIKEKSIIINCEVKSTGKTGVEMEALAGVSVAALTIYDMCKAITKEMIISNIGLLEKSGGKSGLYRKSSEGKVVAVCISEKKGTLKKEVSEVTFVEDRGIKDDAHFGPGIRQVSLLASESIEKMKNRGVSIHHGSFGENVITEGIDLVSFPVGTKLKIGHDVLCEVSQIGKECHNPCAIYHTVGDCIMPREGIFIKVITGGSVKKGDLIDVI